MIYSLCCSEKKLKCNHETDIDSMWYSMDFYFAPSAFAARRSKTYFSSKN